MMMIRESRMPNAEHDFKVIIYPAYDTRHKLRFIKWNKILLTQNPPEW